MGVCNNARVAVPWKSSNADTKAGIVSLRDTHIITSDKDPIIECIDRAACMIFRSPRLLFRHIRLSLSQIPLVRVMETLRIKARCSQVNMSYSKSVYTWIHGGYNDGLHRADGRTRPDTAKTKKIHQSR